MKVLERLGPRDVGFKGGLLCLAILSACSLRGLAELNLAVQLVLDTSEADGALRILHKQRVHETVIPDDWQRVFATTPYQWLKARETAMGRAFSDEEFKTFLLSPEAASKEQDWQETLVEMKRADMQTLGAGVLAACAIEGIGPGPQGRERTKGLGIEIHG